MNNIAIIVPSLDPDKQLNKVVDGMTAAGFNKIILVDDGSHEECKAPFKLAVKEHPECILLVHEVNKGKGRAMKTAFSYILDNMPEIDGCITIDSDGQHTPEDAIRLAEKMVECPDNIVFGCRDFDDEAVPLHNKLGNKITRWIFNALIGMNISDTQTGLRGFPRKYLAEFLEIEGERYEYESNMLMYMSDFDIPFSEISIKTLYIDDNKSSHFNVIKDSYRIYKPIIGKSTSVKYVLSSFIGSVVDLTVFTILNSIFGNVEPLLLETLLTTGIARIVSGFTNYWINHNWVFKSNVSKMKSAAKYFLTAVSIYCSSYILCSIAFYYAEQVGIVGFGKILIKLLIDLLLFVVGYLAQKHWVFKKK